MFTVKPLPGIVTCKDGTGTGNSLNITVPVQFLCSFISIHGSFFLCGLWRGWGNV